MFKVGQKVVCVQTSPDRRIQKDNIYTIRAYEVDKGYALRTRKLLKPMPVVLIKEVILQDITAKGGEAWYDARYFRPLDWAEETLERAREAHENDPLQKRGIYEPSIDPFFHLR